MKLTKEKCIEKFNNTYFSRLDPSRFRYFTIDFDSRILEYLSGKMCGPLPLKLYNHTKFVKPHNRKFYYNHWYGEYNYSNNIKDYRIVGPSGSGTLSYVFIYNHMAIRVLKNNNSTIDWLLDLGFKEAV